MICVYFILWHQAHASVQGTPDVLEEQPDIELWKTKQSHNMIYVIDLTIGSKVVSTGITVSSLSLGLLFPCESQGSTKEKMSKLLSSKS
jgi:hypothetical protein